MAEPASGFLSRWAQRKAQVRCGEVAVVAPEAAPTQGTAAPLLDASSPVPAVTPPARAPDAPPAEPAPPTMADVALLTRESDYTRFVGAGVDDGVKRAAMKKLFADPHFNVMDGLDTYIADYGQPDPIPLSMLRQMNQSKFLRLFDDEESDEENKRDELVASASATDPVKPTPDDDPDLRLQQDDAVGQPGPEPGPRA